jgi:hypothetical protein
MVILEQCEKAQRAAEREVYWLRHFLQLGTPLVNDRRKRGGGIKGTCILYSKDGSAL